LLLLFDVVVVVDNDVVHVVGVVVVGFVYSALLLVLVGCVVCVVDCIAVLWLFVVAYCVHTCVVSDVVVDAVVGDVGVVVIVVDVR